MIRWPLKRPTSSIFRAKQHCMRGFFIRRRAKRASFWDMKTNLGVVCKEMGINSSTFTTNLIVRLMFFYFPWQTSAAESAESCSLIREGAPCEPVPSASSVWDPDPHQFFEEGARIEAGFRKYFHRADPTQKDNSVQILVCHGNVIRYFVCRALQLPPQVPS